MVIEQRAKLGPLQHPDAGADALEEGQAVPTAEDARRPRVRANHGRSQAGLINTISVDRLLSIYLNDHWVGSVIGLKLARRARAGNAGTPLGDYLEDLASEIQSDREALRSLMDELGIRRSRLKAFGAWTAEKLGRMKLNGRLRSYSPLSRLLELESLYLGITGKRELWRALQRIFGNELPRFDFEELVRRADRQAAEVAEQRLEAVSAALISATDSGRDLSRGQR
jgi:hypothetical protein